MEGGMGEPDMMLSHGHDDHEEVAVEGPEPKIPNNSSDVVTKVVELGNKESLNKAIEEPSEQLGHDCHVHEILVEAPELKLPFDYVNVTKVAEFEKEDLHQSISLCHARDYEVIEKAPEQKLLPHNYHAIIRSSDSLVDETSLKKLYDSLHSGLFLNQKTKKYWVEAKSGYNCFMLFARTLSITWSDDKQYWHWPYWQATSDVLVDVAELLNVWWLEVRGNFDTSNLTPRVMYEISFVVMLRESIYGWEVPVNLQLVLPDGERKERKEWLLSKPRGQWVEILVGEFCTSPEKAGDLQFSLFEFGGQAKKGLVIKGVIIKPRKSIDEKLNNDCFTLIARDLLIAWGDNNCYWRWSCWKENKDVYVEVAELLKVCSLDVHGKFDTSKLSPGIMYEVAFTVMLKDNAFGWEVPVHFRLLLPDGKTQEHEEHLLSKPRGEWIELKVGEFQASPEKAGDIQFSLFGNRKSGLIIKGVTIRPKN
ncbi:immune-associated nucleotide-binding protein 10-like isoform X2 [Telopea speciosissima]|uniref:immune-associated nucleotide-binding protein 10-like isoform X2 n=1 Tax=Telopea speciosissima TaxID=54955 RepID=UPI001CC611F8|nr:immune-associated nucleotide-binding protein 10-like isoform X2 [Telopea speciosissima]